jgi:hypothetical protein
MIRFFRTLRHRFITNGKTGKYFTYALGEILLVVIGILIALQINNWNEVKKNRAYELTMLREVKGALETDSDLLLDLLPYLEACMHSIHQLAELKNDPTLPTDSLYFHLQMTLSFGTNLSFNKSPYQAIESGGLDRISNPEVRSRLSKLYGYNVSTTELWVNEVLRTELFKKKDLFAEIFGLQTDPEPDNEISTKIRLDHPQVIYNNPDFDQLLTTAGWTLPNTLQLISSLQEQMDLLITEIDKELEKS